MAASGDATAKALARAGASARPPSGHRGEMRPSFASPVGPPGVPGATGPPAATSHVGEVGDSYLRLSLAAVHLVQKPGRFHLGETGRQVMPDRLTQCEPGG